MTDDNTEFDFQKALKGIQEGKPFTGKDGVLTSLIKNLAEAALEAELDSHLGREVSANRRNGKSKKTIKSLDGNFELETPRDRDREGTFTPKIVKKHQTILSDEIEQKIIALYGLGMSYNDIAAHLKEIYGLEISNGTLSAVTPTMWQIEGPFSDLAFTCTGAEAGPGAQPMTQNFENSPHWIFSIISIFYFVLPVS